MTTASAGGGRRANCIGRTRPLAEVGLMALHVASEAPRRMRAVHSDMVGLEEVKASAYQVHWDRPLRSWRRSLTCEQAPTPMVNNELPLICIYWLPAHLTELGGLMSISHEGN
jgi:hypothetical protein